MTGKEKEWEKEQDKWDECAVNKVQDLQYVVSEWFYFVVLKQHGFILMREWIKDV